MLPLCSSLPLSYSILLSLSLSPWIYLPVSLCRSSCPQSPPPQDRSRSGRGDFGSGDLLRKTASLGSDAIGAAEAASLAVVGLPSYGQFS